MIAIDSQVLIWAVKKKASENRLYMIERASAFVASIEKTGEKLMIPSLVASEFLVRYPEDDRPEALSRLQRRFFVAPFDAKAAWFAARMFADKTAWDKSRQEMQSEDYSRPRIKTDISILATAMAHDATAMYVEDIPLHGLAQNLKSYIPFPVDKLPHPDAKDHPLFAKGRELRSIDLD